MPFTPDPDDDFLFEKLRSVYKESLDLEDPPAGTIERAQALFSTAACRRTNFKRILYIFFALGAAFAGLVLVAAISQSSVPGDSAYPLKRAIESVQVTLALDAAARVEIHLRLAANRLYEAQRLLRQRQVEPVSTLLDDYLGQVLLVQKEFAESVLDPDSSDMLDAKTLRTINANLQLLNQLEAASPPELQPAFGEPITQTRMLLDIKPARSPVSTPTPSLFFMPVAKSHKPIRL